MKPNEFKKWLANLGATFSEGGNHTMAHLNGRKRPIPVRHGNKDLDHILIKDICKQLGLKKHPF